MQICENVTIIPITTSTLKVVCPYKCVIQEIFFQKTMFYMVYHVIKTCEHGPLGNP